MNDKKLLRVGVIGGGFGRVHILGFQECENVKVVAFCQRTKDKAEKLASDFDIPNVFTNYKDLINLEELDIVTVSAPPLFHHQMVTEAIAAGKHVLCEKPMAMNTNQAEDMLKKAEEAGIIHMMGLEFRYVPGIFYMKQLVNEGYLGNVVEAYSYEGNRSRANQERPLNWRHKKEIALAGAMGDSFAHQIDILRWIVGDFKKVSGLTNIYVKERKSPDGSGNIEKVTAEDTAAFLAELEGGVQTIIHTSGVAAHESALKIYGDKGLLICKRDPMVPNGRLLGTLFGTQQKDGIPKPIPLPVHLTEKINNFNPNEASGRFLFSNISKRFVNAIRENKQIDPNFREGVATQKVIDAMLESAKERKWIDVK